MVTRGWTACVLALVLALPVRAEDAHAEVQISVRLEWLLQDGSPWQGTIRLDSGTIERYHRLSFAVEGLPVRQLGGAELRVESVPLRAYSGMDVELRCPLNAKLVVSSEPADAKPIEIVVADLLQSGRTLSLGAPNRRLQVRRSPGDGLSLKWTRRHLIFRPGEEVDFDLAPNLLVDPRRLPPSLAAARVGDNAALPEVPAKVTADVKPARETVVVGHTEQAKALAVNPRDPTHVAMHLRLPETEGVYDLTFVATPQNLPALERTVQVVVLDPNRQPPRPLNPDAKPVQVDQVNLSEPLAGRFVLSSGDLRSEQLPLGKFILAGAALPPTPPVAQPRSTTSWICVALKVSHPSRPHLLETDYPDDSTRSLGISVWEPNAAGQLVPVQLDSGVYTGGAHAPTGLSQTHHLLFWPRTSAPLVLLTSRRDGVPAAVGGLRLLELPGDLPPLKVEQPKDEQRLLGLYYDGATFPENFGSIEGLDRATGRCLDDWVTFYLGARRLADYLKWTGYNSLLINAVGGGSALYPTQVFEPNLRYDSGALFETGQDPMRKDVLEMLLEVFDRESLVLIPAVSFSAPLEELERRLRQEGGGANVEPASSGILLVGADGQSRRQVRRAGGTDRGPGYNPLHPLVQEAMVRVVSELLDRTKDHPSCRHVALLLEDEGYAQLPSLNWGYDDETIARFARDTGTKVPGRPGDAHRFEERFRFLTTSMGARFHWVKWRARELIAFYRRLAALVSEKRKDGKLILATVDLLYAPTANDERYRLLRQQGSILAADLLRFRGIDLAELETVPGIVVLRPSRIGPVDRLSGGYLDRDLNLTPDLDALYSRPATSGGLCVHQLAPTRLVDFERRVPSAGAYTWLVSLMVPSGRHNAERLAHHLASLDAHMIFDGGWMAPMGHEETTQEFARAFRALPAARFQAPAVQSQPLTVRVHGDPEGSYLYLVNDAYYPIGAEITLGCSKGTAVRDLAGRLQADDLKLAEHGDGSLLKLSLEPFEVFALRFSVADLRVVEAQVKIPESVETDFQRLLKKLNDRLTILKKLNDRLTILGRAPGPTGALQPLPNGGFEQIEERGLPVGWQRRGEAGTRSELDTRGAHGGKHSLRLTADGSSAGVSSPEFRLPPSPFPGIHLWLRGGRSELPVRLSVTGDSPAGRYESSASLPVKTEWSGFLFRLQPLPPAAVQNLRLTIELSAAGSLWIDDVSLTRVALSADEQSQLYKTQAAASRALSDRRFADFQRLTGGYWGNMVLSVDPVEAPDDQLAKRGAPPPTEPASGGSQAAPVAPSAPSAGSQASPVAPSAGSQASPPSAAAPADSAPMPSPPADAAETEAGSTRATP